MNSSSRRSFRELVLLSPLVVLSCSSPAPAPCPVVTTHTTQDLREPFTRYSEIWADGKKVAYLLSYEPIPVNAHVQRDLPTGAYRIQDLSFVDVGFVTPQGDVRRHTVPGSSVSLGYHELIDGLTVFYSSSQPVVLRPLQVPKAAEVK